MNDKELKLAKVELGKMKDAIDKITNSVQAMWADLNNDKLVISFESKEAILSTLLAKEKTSTKLMRRRSKLMKEIYQAESK